MTEFERLEEGIRRADQAGDVEAVRILGTRYRELQSQAQQARPDYVPIPGTVEGMTPDTRSLRQRGVGAINEALGPTVSGALDWADRQVIRHGPPIAGTIMGTPAGPPGMMLGGGIGNVIGAEADTLSRALRGEEVAAESFPGRMLPEFREGALMGAVSAGARGLLGAGEKVLRSRARGGMSIPEARIAQHEEIARQAAAGVSDPRSVLAKVMAEAAKATTSAGTSGAAAGLGFEFLAPGSGALAGAITGTGMMVINTLNRLQPTVRNILANNPKFAAWALSTGTSKAATVGGAAAGTAAVATGTFAADQVRDLIDLTRSADPETADAIKSFVDELAIAGREQQAAEQPQPQQRRTSIGPNAIPQPQWGRRPPASGGIGPVAPQPSTRTIRR